MFKQNENNIKANSILIQVWNFTEIMVVEFTVKPPIEKHIVIAILALIQSQSFYAQ